MWLFEYHSYRTRRILWKNRLDFYFQQWVIWDFFIIFEKLCNVGLNLRRYRRRFGLFWPHKNVTIISLWQLLIITNYNHLKDFWVIFVQDYPVIEESPAFSNFFILVLNSLSWCKQMIVTIQNNSKFKVISFRFCLISRS